MGALKDDTLRQRKSTITSNGWSMMASQWCSRSRCARLLRWKMKWKLLRTQWRKTWKMPDTRRIRSWKWMSKRQTNLAMRIQSSAVKEKPSKKPRRQLENLLKRLRSRSGSQKKRRHTRRIVPSVKGRKFWGQGRARVRRLGKSSNVWSISRGRSDLAGSVKSINCLLVHRQTSIRWLEQVMRPFTQRTSGLKQVSILVLGQT